LIANVSLKKWLKSPVELRRIAKSGVVNPNFGLNSLAPPATIVLEAEWEGRWGNPDQQLNESFRTISKPFY